MTRCRPDPAARCRSWAGCDSRTKFARPALLWSSACSTSLIRALRHQVTRPSQGRCRVSGIAHGAAFPRLCSPYGQRPLRRPGLHGLGCPCPGIAQLMSPSDPQAVPACLFGGSHTLALAVPSVILPAGATTPVASVRDAFPRLAGPPGAPGHTVHTSEFPAVDAFVDLPADVFVDPGGAPSTTWNPLTQTAPLSTRSSRPPRGGGPSGHRPATNRLRAPGRADPHRPARFPSSLPSPRRPSCWVSPEPSPTSSSPEASCPRSASVGGSSFPGPSSWRW